MPDDRRDRLEDLRIDRSREEPERPWLRRLLLLGLAVVLVGGAGWWLLGRDRGLEVETAAVREAAAGTAQVSVLDASGYVVARRQATVSSKVTGRVVEVNVEEGLEVEAGQILARLDDANVRRQLALAEAELAASESDVREVEALLTEAELGWRRTSELVGGGVASQAALDMAQAERDSLAARLAAARDRVGVAGRSVEISRQDLEDLLIRAPFDGVAISKNAQPGEIISPISAGGGFTRTGITTIVDMGSLEIEVDVNEAFIQRVEPDQRVVATLDAYPEWKIPAHVITTVPAADRQKATVKVRIGFDELGDPRILPDMGVKVSFQAEAGAGAPAAPRLLAPQGALRREADATVVFVVGAEGVVERRAIAVGGTSGGEIEALSGLHAGERVVLDPPAELADGTRVREQSN